MDRGLYYLTIYLARAKILKIGSLGRIFFKPGYYLYTGRAKRSLSARIDRHKRRKKTLRWHIDYLLSRASLQDIKIFPLEELRECQLNYKISRLKGAEIPAKGFGSSDCRCKSHLVYFSFPPTFSEATNGKDKSIKGLI